ncbi:hypothetical protein QTP88_027235 [Uroleucon formosanum]
MKTERHSGNENFEMYKPNSNTNHISTDFKLNKLNELSTSGKKTVKDNQKILEEDILLRIISENKIQRMADNIQFKDDFINQQLNDTKTFVEIQRLNKKYHYRLIGELGAETKDDTNRNKVMFQLLENEFKYEYNGLDAAQDFKITYPLSIELNKQREDLLHSNNVYLKNINFIEQLRVFKEPNYISKIRVLDQELTAMQNYMSQKIEKYQDLLNMENSIHQKLLGSKGRKRLGITSNPCVVGSPRAKKRKLFKRDVSRETGNTIAYIITISSTSDIEIVEVCPDGQFVQLYNKGSKEFSLSGYKLVRATTDQNVSTVFKFHNSVNLGTGNRLTVWSSTDSNQIHKHIAESIVMDIQAWVVGDCMATILLNREGKEVASHVLKKTTDISFTSQ